MIDLDMGKYGFYVWGSYGVSCLALAILTILSLRDRATKKKKLEALQAAMEDVK